MKQSFLPKPLFFKEWKEHRWWLLAGIVLLLYSPFSSLFASLASQSSDINESLLWRVLVPVIYHVQYTPGSDGFPIPGSYAIHGRPSVSVFGVIVSMALLIALITVERSRCSLWYTLSFPVRRMDVLRVKIILAAGIVICGFLLDFLLLLACDLAAHRAIPLAVLFQWLGQNLLITLTMMAIGLVCAAVIRMGLIAGLAALLIPTLTWALGLSVLPSVPSTVGLSINPPAEALNSLTQGPTTAAGHISMFLRALSPTSYFSGTGGFGGSPPGQKLVIYSTFGHPMNPGIILWFIFLILVSGTLGIYAYLRAPMENSTRWVLFPRLQPWFLWLFYGLPSFLVVNSVTANNNHLSNTPYLMTVYWLGIWLVLGLILTGTRAVYHRAFISRVASK